MAKTPVGQKVRKVLNTPKTLPKKLRGTPTIQNDASKPVAVQRTKLDFKVESSIVASICTPGRTTRSMVRVLSSDMPPPPALPRATPSKRKTIATPKSLAKKSLAPTNDLNTSRKSARGKKATKTVNVSPAKSSEDDFPSVSMLETEQTPGKYVRSHRSANKENVDSAEDELPSVSMLVTDKSASKKRRTRKPHLIELSAVDSSEDDLPSVSILGGASNDQSVRSRKSKIQETAEDDLPSLSLQLTETSIKSNERNEEKTQSRRSKRSINKIESNQEEESIESIVLSQSVAESVAEDEVAIEPKGDRNSSVRRSVKLTPKDNRNSIRRSTKTMTPATSVSPNADSGAIDNTQTDNEEQLKTNQPLNGESEEKPSNDVKTEANFVVPMIVVSQSDTAKTDETEEYVSAEDEVHDLPKPLKRKSIGKKNRVSVIDLTDSPMVSNNRSVLNKTFSPEKKPEEEKDDKNKTFTEETGNTTAINDKTFSPLPNQSTAKKSAMKHVLLPPPAYSPMPLKLTRKSIGKKKSPQLKRLQGTPMGKTNSRNNLNASKKMTSAKKTKVAEAAADLVEQTKAANAPKIFNFGDDNMSHQFRFSLVSESLKSNNNRPRSK